MSPDQKNQCVDWQNPQHKDENRVSVVGEIEVCGESLYTLAKIPSKDCRQTYSFPGMPLSSHAGGKLNNASNHISELVWNDCRDQDQKDGSVDQASSGSRRSENRHIPESKLATAFIHVDG